MAPQWMRPISVSITPKPGTDLQQRNEPRRRSGLVRSKGSAMKACALEERMIADATYANDNQR
jgi:hypothetical protein